MEEENFNDVNEEAEDTVEEELDENNPEHAFAILEKEYAKVITLPQFYFVFIIQIVDTYRTRTRRKCNPVRGTLYKNI